MLKDIQAFHGFGFGGSPAIDDFVTYFISFINHDLIFCWSYFPSHIGLDSFHSSAEYFLIRELCTCLFIFSFFLEDDILIGFLHWLNLSYLFALNWIFIRFLFRFYAFHFKLFSFLFLLFFFF